MLNAETLGIVNRILGMKCILYKSFCTCNKKLLAITGEPEVQLNETINYNEHFDWRWAQGRFGFGIFGM